MKTKYLFSALLGGALLASCSMDDELDTKLASQGSNLSAPVFTLHFDESDETRATMDSSAKLTFEAEDLFSLYHGLPIDLSLFTKYDNAIYEGTGDGENFDIATKSMVKEGQAIMVFPADLKNLGSIENGGNGGALTIEIDRSQTPDTKEKTPFMSEFIKIENPAKEDGTSAAAGYGVHYDIYLKPVAATLLLDLNSLDFADNLTTGANELKISKVELVSSDNGGLATTVNIIANKKAPTSQKTYKSWSAISEIYPVTTTERSITTTDIKNGIATFTLFPAISSYSGTYDIKIHTNYGVATITNEVGKEVFVNGDKKQTVTDGLKEILVPSSDGKTGCWSESTKENSKFYGEKIGKAYKRTLTDKITELKMNGMHIEDEDVLVDIVNVIKEMKSGEQITLKLDGKGDEGKFVMTTGKDKGLEAYKTAISLTPAVTFEYCDGNGEKCNKVVLKNTDGTTAVIPTNLKFKTGSNNVVELEGEWAFSSNKNDSYSYENVKSLTVAKEGVLVLNGDVKAVTGLSEAVVNSGEINVTGNTVLEQSVTNDGKITINANVTLKLAGNGILINNVTPAAAPNAADVNKASRGKIENGGVLGIADETEAKIHNYGVIYAKNNSYTMLSTNANLAGGLTSAFSAANVYGIIELSDKPLAVEIKDAEKGFIKRIKNEDNDSEEGANYVVLNGTCSKLKTGGLKYVEINAPAVTLDYEAGDNKPETKWNALIVSANSVVTIPANKTVVMATEGIAVVKGTIVKGGTFTYYGSTFAETTYFGNTEGDANNIIGTGK